MYKTVTSDDWKALQGALPKDAILTNPIELIPYEVDGSLGMGEVQGVLLPRNAEELVRIVKWASARNIPLIARGAGTGLSGGAVAPEGGVMVSLARMKSVLELDEAGRSVVVQPGMVHLNLDEFVKTKGLYYPPDPASGRACTLGGNLAENAGGPHCFKYGVTTNYVLGLETVLGDGRVLHTGGRAFDYPEYDLTGLLVGGEGTLGIITEAQLRLVRNVPGIKTLMATFPSVEVAGEAVSAVISKGLVPATLEMMDKTMIGIVENYVHAGLPVEAEALLIIEADGHPESLDSQMAEIFEVMKAQGATELRLAQNQAERDKIWFARKSAFGAIAQISPAYLMVDGAVPRSKLAKTLSEINRICEAHDLHVGYVFHAGDGNLHPLILFNPQDAAMVERMHGAGREVMELCVKIGGTITGEHGVGSEKRQYMRLMFNEDELRVLKDIKDVFDPRNLMNPGKILPDLAPAQPRPAVQSHPAANAAEYAPRDVADAADAVRSWNAAARSVRIRGGGTKSGLLPAADVVLSTRELCGIRAYELKDLFVTVGAGTRLADLQAQLARDNVWTPLVAPWPDATVGGTVASNFNAPLRMRYGAIRDLLLAMTVVMPDGRVIRAGKPVVKNVAGYDLPKLEVGAHGTLGLITDISLKLMPLPRRRTSLVVALGTLSEGLRLGSQLLRVCLVASALLLCKGCEVEGVQTPYALIYTAEGVPEDVDAELAQARAALAAAGASAPQEFDGLAGSEVWAKWLRADGAYPLVRTGIAPKDLGRCLVDVAPQLGAAPFVADIAAGLIYSRGGLAALRPSAERLGGYAAVVGGNSIVADRWGRAPEGLDLMRGLKARWDPSSSFNPAAFRV
jgi:D-lactate dehydrogenase (cytochrome)